MRIFISVIFIILSQHFARAQKVHFLGKVQDSTGQALPSASVVVAHFKTGVFQSFAITDKNGNFAIELSPQKTYSVKVNYMGYLPVIDTLVVHDKNIIKKYILKLDKQQLDGVEIKYEMPVTVKGDTIVYNADSFTNGTEKKLGDVLKKMPGIEVEKDGTVKVEGKTVKKVMVEGKNFFEGDSKLASKNIPANAVKKVQVLRNYNENSQLRNFEDNDGSYALNIKLKKGKKNFWFGDITAGGGTGQHYLLHPKLFFYSPKRTYNIIIDANNNGSAPMTFSDYFKMIGGLRALFRKSGSGFNNSSDMLGFSLLPNDKAKMMQTGFGAASFTYQLTPKLDLNSFFIINKSQVNMLTESQKLYTASGIYEQSRNDNSQNNFTGILKTSLEYNPNPDLNIKYDLLGKFITLSQNEHFTSSVRDDTQSINKDENQSLSQNFELYKTLKNSNLVSVSIQHNFNNRLPSLEILSSGEFFTTSSLINMTPQQTYDLLQYQKLKSNDLSAVADYYYIINDVSHIDISSGAKLVWQELSSNITQKLDNGKETELNSPALQNDARYGFNDIYIGAYYKVLWGNLIFRPGISGHYYLHNDRQFNDTKEQIKWFVSPEIFLKYRFATSQRLVLKYKLTNSFSDIKKYAQAYIIRSFNNLQSGNRDLKSILQHTITLRYSVFNMFKFYHFYSSISYSRSLHPVRQQIRQVQTDLVGIPVNLNNDDESWTFYAGYGKRYIYWKFKINSDLMFSKNYNIINYREVASNSLSQNYGLTVNSNLSGFFNFDISYNLNINHFDNDLRNSLYVTQKPSAGVELRFFKQTTQLNINYEYYDQKQQNQNMHKHYGFLSTELFYQKAGSRWEFSLKSNNLLNTGTINNENLSDLYFVTSQYYVMPNYWLLQVKYKL